MSNDSRYTKIIPAVGNWYLLVKANKETKTQDSIYPIAAWAECNDGRIIGLSNAGKYQPAELFSPPPGFTCLYLREDELTPEQQQLIGRN
ncbi:hypothetical protein F6Q07_21730 [Pectobacterium parmentieri]|uniref:hypothetical protein n=1 Tax=Pectobacterium parmentieri TaxID=1905730 RepID=UPI000EAD47F2|nr:hypothetical protein [Pectobacterium parmentieri]AYH00881.1 hypothetical protein C5E26_07980 [Pectobacterium parmentieri]AYH27190.1 hypothetical protein C5E20_08625 [Pectobacterium parmentieri]AYH31503.1 hypothetical protein C5E19_07670 [Pectobacterium parmentieri]MBI0520705.1 hypothetical protein [Pectobacterium parmentieri]QQA74522.1 hypothetical protein JBL47_13990 [Pectobacterium parmentieri]